MRPLFTTAVLTFAVAAALGSPATLAQENRLPDIGSSARTLLGPAEQKQYGELMLAQLRSYDYILEDPLIDSWLRGLGNRLGAASDNPKQQFTFFMMRDRQVNAFATLGGYVGVNAGLVLVAESEGEVAGVLGHEIAHVTQSHALRSVERAQRDQIPMLLAMVGAIALSQAGGSSSGSSSSTNGALAAISGIQGLAAQRQINYTRSNESEADRIGIRTMVRAHYDPADMATMFGRMLALERSNRGGDKDQIPDYLRSHPVTTTRIAEAKERAAQMEAAAPEFTPTASTASNPLLPSSLQITAASQYDDSTEFGWVRERLRVLSADTPAAAINEYEHMRRSGELDDAQRYGLAYARLLSNQGTAAMADLAPLVAKYPDDIHIVLTMAQAESRAGKHAAADARFEALLSRMPRNRAVALTYADVLAERNNPVAGKRAQELLRPMLLSASEDPLFQATFARVNEIAGDPIRAGEAYAQATYLNGRPEQALIQLNTLKKRDDLDYYARVRIDSRIAAITPVVLELRRQGVEDPDLQPD